MDDDRVVKALGARIDTPAVSLEEAKDRLAKAKALYNNNKNDFNLNEKIRLASEIELMRDQMAWYTGYSDIKDENGEDNFLLFIIPGSLHEPDDEAPKAQQLRDYKEAVKADLARYYKYSPAMLRKREKMIREFVESSCKLHEIFGKYGKDIVLEHNGETLDYKGLLVMDGAIRELIKEKVYINRAKYVRNPFKLPHQGYTGRYKKIVVTLNTKRWIHAEPRLKSVLEYIDSAYEGMEEEDIPINLVYGGMMIYKALETLIRIVLHGKNSRYVKDNGKKSTRYETTKEMRKAFGVDEYLDIFEIGKLARRLIGVPIEGLETEFVNNTEFVDTENIKYDDFIDQMASVQQFYDIMKEDKEFVK
jgi:hypothetical protein